MAPRAAVGEHLGATEAAVQAELGARHGRRSGAESDAAPGTAVVPPPAGSAAIRPLLSCHPTSGRLRSSAAPPTLTPSRKARVCCTGTAWIANCAPATASRGDVVAVTLGGSEKSCAAKTGASCRGTEVQTRRQEAQMPARGSRHTGKRAFGQPLPTRERRGVCVAAAVPRSRTLRYRVLQCSSLMSLHR